VEPNQSTSVLSAFSCNRLHAHQIVSIRIDGVTSERAALGPTKITIIAALSIPGRLGSVGVHWQTGVGTSRLLPTGRGIDTRRRRVRSLASKQSLSNHGSDDCGRRETFQNGVRSFRMSVSFEPYKAAISPGH